MISALLPLIVFIVAIGVVFLQRDWFDKKLFYTWVIPGLLVLAILAFVVVSIAIDCLIYEREFNLLTFLRIYGVFSQTSTAYTPDDASNEEYGFNLVLSFLGAFLFAGLLISAFNNMLNQRIEKVKNGQVDYPFKNHIVIIGANDSLLPIVRTVAKKFRKRKIILVTSKDFGALSKFRSILGDKIWKRIYYIKADILSPLDKDNRSSHYLRKTRIAKSKEIYIIGDAKSSECDIETSRILSSINLFFSWQKKFREPIKCFLEYSNLQMALNVCRSQEAYKLGGKPLCSLLRVIPFDFNLIMAYKAFSPVVSDFEKQKKEIPYSSVDIVGFNHIGQAMCKFVMLSSYYSEYTRTRIRVYYTPEQTSAVNLFRLCHSIDENRVTFIEIPDYADYISRNDKAEIEALCGDNLDVNIHIAYANQREDSNRITLVYSTSPILSGIFQTYQGEKMTNVYPFGNLNQRLELDYIHEKSLFLYKVYLSKPTFPEDEVYYKQSFDNKKWRLQSLFFLMNLKKERSAIEIIEQQKAAVLLSGYRLGNETDFNKLVVAPSELEEMVYVYTAAVEKYGESV